MNVTKKNFEQEVLKSEVPVLVDFYADWCAPCRALAPVLDDLEQESNGAYRIAKVNTDQDRDLAVEYEVSVLPTLVLFKNGVIIQKLVGQQSKSYLKQLLTQK